MRNMITLTEIGNFISNQGFPIACAAWLFYQQSKQNKYNIERDQALQRSINQNTKVINELVKELRKNS